MQSSPSSFPSSFFTIHLLSSLSFYWLNTWIFLPAYPIFMDMSESLKQAFVNSVQFSHSVVSNSLWPHRLQHTRPPCPSPTPGVYSDSCPLSSWCHPTISSSVIPFSSCPQSFPASRSFQWVSSLHQVAKIFEFQLQHQSFQWTSGLISFRMDLLDLLAVQGTLKSLLQHHSLKT